MMFSSMSTDSGFIPCMLLSVKKVCKDALDSIIMFTTFLFIYTVVQILSTADAEVADFVLRFDQFFGLL